MAAMTDSDKSYLAYMAARLLEMKRVLKPTGSMYLHCDPTMSHYLKLVMDADTKLIPSWQIGDRSGMAEIARFPCDP